MSYEFIEVHSQHYPVASLCSLLAVSRSGFYDYLARKSQGPSAREQEQAQLVERIKAIHDKSEKRYGSPRIHAELKKQEIKCSLWRDQG